MSWLELKLGIGKHEAEAMELLLWACGAVSVTLIDAADDPLFEPGVGETPLWDKLVVTGLFEGDTDADELKASLAQRWHGELPLLHCGPLEDRDWARSWLDDFKPMRFGKRLWVCPSWWHNEGQPADSDQWVPSPDDARDWQARHQDLLAQMAGDDQVVIQLDPGLAFGTGTHPTTALCLAWLDANDPAGRRLIDFGCGSGILGIGALLLGAGQVLGVDNDPQALTATRDNCSKNALAEARFPVYLPDAFTALSGQDDFVPADGVIANILAGTLIDLAGQLATLVRSSGWILLSGILAEQQQSVIDAFSPWFEDFDTAQQEDWVRISARKR